MSLHQTPIGDLDRSIVAAPCPRNSSVPSLVQSNRAGSSSSWLRARVRGRTLARPVFGALRMVAHAWQAIQLCFFPPCQHKCTGATSMNRYYSNRAWMRIKRLKLPPHRSPQSVRGTVWRHIQAVPAAQSACGTQLGGETMAMVDFQPRRSQNEGAAEKDCAPETRMQRAGKAQHSSGSLGRLVLSNFLVLMNGGIRHVHLPC